MWRAIGTCVIVACVGATATAADAAGPAVLIPTQAKYTLAKPGTWTHELAIFALDDKDVAVNSIVVVTRPALDLDGGHETEVWADPVDSAIDSPRFHRQAPARV